MEEKTITIKLVGEDAHLETNGEFNGEELVSLLFSSYIECVELIASDDVEFKNYILDNAIKSLQKEMSQSDA